MNGLFGTFGRGSGGYMMPNVQTPQQNVANYLRMPVINAPQQPQYPSMLDFAQSFQTKPQNAFEHPAIRMISGQNINQSDFDAWNKANSQPNAFESPVINHIAGISSYNANANL